MKQSQLDKVLNIVGRTGDRIIIMDKAIAEPMVLMDLANYEKLLSLSQPVNSPPEEEIMEKIGVAIPSQNNRLTNEVGIQNKQDRADVDINMEESLVDVPGDEEEKFYFEPIE